MIRIYTVLKINKIGIRDDKIIYGVIIKPGILKHMTSNIALDIISLMDLNHGQKFEGDR